MDPNKVGKDIFKDQQARKRQEDWYERFLDRAKCEVESQTISTSGGESHVLLAGDDSNPPLFCLHAMLTGSAHLLSEIWPLTDHYHLILPDIPGHSVKGIPHRFSYKTDAYTDWFLEIVSHFEAEKIRLMGVSLGGFIAHRFASKWPERVERLVLIVPAGIVQASVVKGMMRMMVPMLRYRFNPNEENLKRLTGFLLSNWDDDWGPFLGDSMHDFITPKSIPPLASDEDLQNLRMPALVIAADQDISFPGEPMVKRVQNLLPNVETELMNDTRHSPPTTPEFRTWLSDRLVKFFG